jgi:hypothetical protein
MVSAVDWIIARKAVDDVAATSVEPHRQRAVARRMTGARADDLAAADIATKRGLQCPGALSSPPLLAAGDIAKPLQDELWIIGPKHCGVGCHLLCWPTFGLELARQGWAP